MAVTAIIGITVAGMSVNALSITTSARAGVQSQAAAEAGIDAAVARLRGAATCSPTMSSASEPAYSVTLAYSTANSVAASTVWPVGCPTASAKFVKITSVGFSQADGIGEVTQGDSRSVEAVYNYTTTSTSIPETGGAVYTYSAAANSGLNNLTLNANQDIAASVKIKSGSITCQSGTTINGDVVLANGSFSSSGGCKITGNLSVSGSATINSGANVIKNVTASGKVGTNYDGNAPVVSVYGTGPSGGKAVEGNVAAGGKIYIDGAVTGCVSSTKSPLGATPAVSTITPSTKIGGNLSAAGELTTWATRCNASQGSTNWEAAGNACAIKASGIVTGTVAYNVANTTAPTPPGVPEWVDFKYTKSEWEALGFDIVKWSTASYCSINNYNSPDAFVAALNTYTKPTVIDATDCNPLLFSLSANSNNGLDLKLKTDIAFISKSFGIEKIKINSNNTTQRKVWFIVPDTTADSQPTCSGGAGNITIGNNVSIGNTVAAIAYTPCLIQDDSTVWRGQLYAKAVTFGANITLNYLPVGLPNTNLDGNAALPPTEVVNGNALGARVSIRDISNAP